MEFKGVDYCEPTWDIVIIMIFFSVQVCLIGFFSSKMTQILSDYSDVVMEIDAQLTSHPIVVPVNHPDEITEIFDAISYGKVSALLEY